VEGRGIVTDIASSPLALALALRFSIGRTLSLTFAVLWRNFWRMSAVALAVTALRVAIEFYVPVVLTGLLSIGVALLMFALVICPVTVATVQHVRGGRPTFADMLRGALRRIVRVSIGTLILFLALFVPPGALLALGAALGLPEILLLLLTGIVTVYALAIFTMWFVAVPVLVTEEVGILSSFRRSRYLTRGHRWGVLALALVLAVIVFAMMTIAMTVRLSLIVNAPIQMMMHPWLSLANVPLGAFSSLMAAIVPAVTYCLLQAEKEGAGTDLLARVFE
jgi:hypothetical protein